MRLTRECKNAIWCFYVKINPKGCGIESASDQLIIFQIKYIKIEKSILESAKSTVSDKAR
jgi:hypothetical protein